MSARRMLMALGLSALCLGAAAPALGLANRVFVSARSGSDANACAGIATPCQTFAGAVTQLNPDGQVIVLDSGGYGPVTITQGVTIEAPTGITAFIHPPFATAITVNAPGARVNLRGLTLNDGSGGIDVLAVGVMSIENCTVTGFAVGIFMNVSGRLNLRNTTVTACNFGVMLVNTSGTINASIDHCHLDSNNSVGFYAASESPGATSTTATFSTANNNTNTGWSVAGNATGGLDVLSLEFCTGSQNAYYGLLSDGTNASSTARYSNCTFTNNGAYGVGRFHAGTLESRGNNTLTGNGSGPAANGVDPFSPM